jgi:hypothetical protein
MLRNMSGKYTVLKLCVLGHHLVTFWPQMQIKIYQCWRFLRSFEI